MKMREIFRRLKRRTPGHDRTAGLDRNWSSDWTPRDWADLPVHHPRRDTDPI